MFGKPLDGLLQSLVLSADVQYPSKETTDYIYNFFLADEKQN